MKRLILSRKTQLLVPLAVVAGAWVWFDWVTAAGVAIGCVAGTAGFWGLWHAVRQIGSASGPGSPNHLPTILVLLAYIGKFVLFIGGVVAVYELGGQAPAGFVVGFILVYSLGISWAQAST